jgi:hypothetical protein
MVHIPVKKSRSSKLQSRWEGPYIVVQCRQGNTYRVKKADNFRKRLTRHHDQLQRLENRPPRFNNHKTTLPEAPAQIAHTHPTTDRSPSEEEDVSDVETEENSSAAESEVDRQEPRRREMRERRPPDRLGDWEYATEESE